MSLFKKIFIGSAICTAVCFSLFFFLSHGILLKRFAALDRERIIRTLKQIKSNFDAEIKKIDTLVLNWAHWDDAYEFILNHNSKFIESNLPEAIFNDQNINLIVFFDTKGRIIYIEKHDLENQKSVMPSKEFMAFLTGTKELFLHKDTASVIKGVTKTPDGLLIFSSRPILTSEAEGPIRGAFLSGLFLDKKEVESLSSGLELQLSLGWSCIREGEAGHKKGCCDAVAINVLDNHFMEASLPLPDAITGTPCGFLRAKVPRLVFSQGRQSINILGWLLFGLAMGLFATIICIIRRYLQRPLRKLAEGVKHISAKDFSFRLYGFGNDELGDLAKAFNAMATSVEKSQESLEARVEDRTQELHQVHDKLHQLSAAIAQSSNPIIITDLDGVIEYVNPKFLSLTGYSEEEIIGANPRIIQSGKTPDATYKMLWDNITSGKEWKGELQNMKKNGEFYWVSATLSPVRNEENVVTHFIAVQDDISERKLMEDSLKNANAALLNLNAELKLKQGFLIQSEKMASIGQLASGVAHEINNPVGFIKSNLGVIEEYIVVFNKLFEQYDKIIAFLKEHDIQGVASFLEAIDTIKDEDDFDFVIDDVESLIKESQDGTSRVQEIVKGLKSFARTDDSNEEEADINEGIRSTLKIVWNELKYKCDIKQNLRSLPMIKCNAGKLNQVFMNIIVNAGHAIEDRGVVEISTEAVDNYIVIRVADTGKGIPKENLNKLFDPFFTTKDVGTGTGLGLSISHGIIEEHGGMIEVESELGKGTVFTIKLPITHESQASGGS